MFIEGKGLVKKYGKGEATVYALDHTDFGKTVARGDITGGLVWNSQDNYKKNKK